VVGLERVEGVLVFRRSTPEGDVRGEVLSREGIILPFVAKGACRGRVRFGGLLEPGVWAFFHLQRSRRSSLLYLREVDLVEPFAGVRSRREAILWALEVLKAVRSLGELRCEGLFGLLVRFLSMVEAGKSPELSSAWFYVELARGEGVLPSPDSCALCGSPTGEVLFLGEEGFGCASCGGVLRLSPQLASVVRGEEPGTIPPEAGEVEAFLAVVRRFLSFGGLLVERRRDGK